MGGDQGLFRSLLDHSSDGIEIIDPDTGRILDVNRRACIAHGYTREEMLRLCVPDIAPYVAERTWVETLRLIKETGSIVLVGNHRRKDGTVFDTEVSASYVVEDRPYVLAIVRDISERKRAERALMESEAQLRQAQKMEAVGRLAGGIAHDFNNLLTVINGNSETLLATLSPDHPHHELVSDIVDAGKRGATLTRQLLAFSRKQVLMPRIVDLNDVLDGLVKLLSRVIGENIDFRLALGHAIGGVRIDPGQFEQAIVNLIVNARDAMPKGGRLEISSERKTCPKGSCVAVRVTDTGCGMDEATKTRIFEPFFTTKEVGHGTGLGLAMVYGFVNQSGGHIDVESAPGRGTTIAIHLPLAQEEEVTAAPRSEKRPEAKRGAETVLLVEDEEAVRRLVKRALSSRGYAVLDARDGEHALELARTHGGRIDLLVTGLIMPRMGGRELAQMLSPDFPHLRTLFMSGYIDPELVVSPDYIQKPFGAKELADRIRELLDRPAEAAAQ